MARIISRRAPALRRTPDLPAVDEERLRIALENLAGDFQLTKEQLAALPTLDEITLIPQDDSDRIENIAGVRAAHPFKLFIGEMEWKMRCNKTLESAHVYMFTNQAIYYESVTDLAYPFNEWYGTPRFIAAVKYYFLLGWEAGLYDERPAFKITNSWVAGLQGACDDLIKANVEMETEKREAKEVKESSESPPPVGLARKNTVLEAQLGRLKTSRSGVAAPNSPSMVRNKTEGMTEKRPSEHMEEQPNFYPPHHSPYHPMPSPHGFPGYFPMYAMPPPFPPSYYIHAPVPQGHKHSTEMPGLYYSPQPLDYRQDVPILKQRAYSHMSITPQPVSIERKRRQEVPDRNTRKRARLDSNRKRSIVPAPDHSDLEHESIELFQKRNDLQARMQEIRDSLSEHNHRALVARLEGISPAKLLASGTL
ncbi:hypothetical protein T440DRAFT_514933 [Plenodomus tracheiphilus IPT5]|uniref:Uncharacterized protein n=1 Tax=Plenodomus tracheiphilus IPT5 TaxID=1408161 RepID=A0A6A7BFS4_9PLEO|nr:hypothetical protein T440DRAFT_514933 [Plenodomus tracheiphilus IPT5]